MTDTLNAPPDTLDDHLELIAKILPYQDRDSLLRLSVVLCNLELQGDGCSLFLYQPERNDLELRESTVMTRFLGQRINLGDEQTMVQETREFLHKVGKRPEELTQTVTTEEVEDWGSDLTRSPLRGFGLTRWAVQFHCPLVIPGIHQDVRWSAQVEPTADADPRHHCELSRSEIGSIAIATFGNETGPLPRGVLRVVRRRDHPAGGLGARELAWLTGFARHLDKYLDVAVTLADLMDLGTKLKFEDFGKSLVALLKQVLDAKGCTIFLELEKTEPYHRDFHCVATTGIFRHGRPITSDQACYTVDPKQPTIDSLTGWVLRFGQLVDLESTLEFDASRLPGLDRPRTEGKTSESPPGDPTHGGPILISPLFLHQGGEPVGAIRVVRSRAEDHSFQLHEKLLFLDISRRLSKVLTNLHLWQVSEKLISLYRQPEEILRRVPREVCRLLGVEGCSVLRLDPDRRLRLAATEGQLEGHEEALVYRLDDRRSEGWTGWVARRGTPLLLNHPDEASRVDPTDPPLHSRRDPSLKHPYLCEIEQPAHRFLAVPILERPETKDPRVLGVIRIPRGQEDALFHPEHQSILTAFAARLSLALNLARRNEALQAVADLANPDKLGAGHGEPAEVVQRVIERAGRLLAEKLELERAQIHPEFLPPTAEPVTAPPVQEPGLEEREIHLGRLKLGSIFFHSPRPLTRRQENLLDLVAGVCANALYSKAVYEKLEALRKGLIRVGEEMTSASPLSQKLQTIARVAAEVTWADTVIIHEFLAPPPGQPVTEGRFRESAWGGTREPHEWKETNFKPDAVPFKVVPLDSPVFAPVARDSEILYHRKEENFIDREGYRSAAALPLQVGDTCVGCIFFNFRKEQLFRPQTQQEILLMTDYAAIAIHQGRLLEETRHLVQEKSNLLKFAEHSLKQPLAGLTDFFDNFVNGVYHDRLEPRHLDDKKAFCTSEVVEIAARQYRLCDYINHLIHNFFTIDRIETERRAGKPSSTPREMFPLKIEECDLKEICSQAVEVAEAILGGRIDCHMPDHRVRRSLDRHSIQMALVDILINAVKFSKSGPGGHHQKPRIKVQLTLGNGETCIQIDDNGPGIDEKDADRIFDLFYRGETSSPGSGIGLFLTRGYVEAHGGCVEVKRSDLGGACFVLHLPLRGGPSPRTAVT